MCHHADTKRRSAALVLGSGRVLSPALPFPRRIADDPSLYLLRALAPARGALLGDPGVPGRPEVARRRQLADGGLELSRGEPPLGFLEGHVEVGHAVADDVLVGLVTTTPTVS